MSNLENLSIYLFAAVLVSAFIFSLFAKSRKKPQVEKSAPKTDAIINKSIETKPKQNLGSKIVTFIIEKIFIPIIVFLFFLVAYSFIKDKFFPGDKSITLARVIDGDTFESLRDTYRLIGINTPERNEFGYNQATYTLE